MSPIGPTYKIGTLTRTHGVHGELAFHFTDDVWDRVEADYVFLELDGLLVPFFFEEWRFRSDTTALVKFEDVDDIHAAERLVGADVFFPQDLTPTDIDEDDLTWRHFTGFEVFQVRNEKCEVESEKCEVRSEKCEVRSDTNENETHKGDTSHSSLLTSHLDTSLLGTVAEVLDQTANILLDVQTPDGRSILIPAHEDFIISADHRQRRLLVNIPPDLLNLNP